MSKKRGSFLGSFTKRYLTYKAFRGTEKAANGCLGVVWTAFKVLLLICAVLIVGYCAVAALPVVAVVLVVIGIVVFVVYRRKKKAAVCSADSGQDVVVEPAASVDQLNKQMQAKRAVEIIADCQQLINDSASLDVVARRYKELFSRLDFLASFSPSELEACGVSLGKPISNIKSELVSNRSAIFCQAIKRAHDKCVAHMLTLKTRKGRENALGRFHSDASKVISENNWPYECADYLNRLCTETIQGLG